MDSEKNFYGRQCGSCGEKMPLSEKVCYCGGPVKLVRFEPDSRAEVNSYHNRKWLAARRNN